jgi:hypothetical protein
MKCITHLDAMIMNGSEFSENDIPDAVTVVTVIQQFAVGGGQVTAPAQVPVCIACRREQLAPLSRAGLLSGVVLRS